MDGRQMQRLCDALITAYSLDDLAQLLRFSLDLRLDAVVDVNAPFATVVFDLANWADRKGALADLVKAAAEDRPNSPELAALAVELAADSPSKTGLRRVDLSGKLHRAAEARPDVNATLITWLINRLLQRDQVRRTLQNALHAVAPRPIVCLLHGSDDECHDKFVQSIVQHQLERLMPARNAATAQHFVLNLPPSYRSRDDLHDFLRADLGDRVLRSALAPAEEINDRLTALRAPAVVQTLMRVESWSEDDRAVVYDYLRFWAAWPPLSAGQLLMIFLCIREQPAPKGLFSFLARRSRPAALAQALSEFASTEGGASRLPDLQSLHVSVLPELAPVSQEDAQQWAQDLAVQEYFAGQDLVGAIAQIYKQSGKSALPMATLHAEVAKLARRPPETRPAALWAEGAVQWAQ